MIRPRWKLAAIIAIALASCGEKKGDPGAGLSSGERKPAADPARPLAGDASAKPLKKLAMITDGPSAYWDTVRKGFDQAAKDSPRFQMEFLVPETATVSAQVALLEKAVADGFEGVAISPVDPAATREVLNEAAGKIVLITQTSDAPESRRLYYVGTNHTEAGNHAGLFMKSLLSKTGGEVYVLAAGLTTEKERARRLALADSMRPGEPLPTIVIVEDLLDGGDMEKAFQNARAVLTSGRPVRGLVGLDTYHGPAIAKALRETGRTEGETKVHAVTYGQEMETLQAVKDGVVFSTIVERPEEIGRRSMMVLASLVGGAGAETISADSKGRIDTGTQHVVQQSVDSFLAAQARKSGE